MREDDFLFNASHYGVYSLRETTTRYYPDITLRSWTLAKSETVSG